MWWTTASDSQAEGKTDVRLKAVLASGFQAEVRIDVRLSGRSRDQYQVIKQKEGSISDFQAEVRINVRLSSWRQDRRGVSDGQHFSVLLQNNTRQYTVSFLIGIRLKPKKNLHCSMPCKQKWSFFYFIFNQEHATFKCIAKQTNTLLVTVLMSGLIFARIKFKMSAN